MDTAETIETTVKSAQRTAPRSSGASEHRDLGHAEASERPDLRHAEASEHPGLEQAITRAREHLLSLQHEGGWWKAELQTTVTMDADDLLLREFLGIRDAALTERAAKWIRSQQRDDGSWANFYRGPGDLAR